MNVEDEPDVERSPGSRGDTIEGESEPRELAAVDELVDADVGRWHVSTEASLHVLDLDRRRVLRLPGRGFGAASVAVLRRDHAELRLLRGLQVPRGRSDGAAHRCSRGWQADHPHNHQGPSDSLIVGTPSLERRGALADVKPPRGVSYTTRPWRNAV